MAKYTLLKKSLKIEDFGKILVYALPVLQFATGGLNLPPVGECQGLLEKR